MHTNSVDAVMAAREFERAGRLLRQYAKADLTSELYVKEVQDCITTANRSLGKIAKRLHRALHPPKRKTKRKRS